MDNYIDKNSNIPLYIQLEEIIVKQILSGVYKENSPIPPEFELISMYKVSRTTVRQALADLISKGYLYRKRGIGTFVSEEIFRKDNNNKNVFHILGTGRFISKYESKVRTMFIKAYSQSSDKAVAEALKIPKGSEVLVLERIRKGAGSIISFSRTYIKLDLIKELEDEAEIACDHLHRYLDSKGYPVEIIKREIVPALLGKEISTIFHLPSNKPVFLLKDYSLMKDGTPIEYSITYLDPSNVSMELTATRTPKGKIEFNV